MTNPRPARGLLPAAVALLALLTGLVLFVIADLRFAWGIILRDANRVAVDDLVRYASDDPPDWPNGLDHVVVRIEGSLLTPGYLNCSREAILDLLIIRVLHPHAGSREKLIFLQIANCLLTESWGKGNDRMRGAGIAWGAVFVSRLGALDQVDFRSGLDPTETARMQQEHARFLTRLAAYGQYAQEMLKQVEAERQRP